LNYPSKLKTTKAHARNLKRLDWHGMATIRAQSFTQMQQLQMLKP
jgi:hypothetical protein